MLETTQTIASIQKGRGPAVLFLHGWGANHRVWQGMIEGNASTHECWAIDLPGFGASAPLKEAWNSEHYVTCLAGWMNEQNIDRPVIVGHSFGGKLALLLASRGLARAVVLCGAAGIRPRRGWRWHLRVWPYKALKLLAAFPLFAPILNDVVVRLRERSDSADYRAAVGPLRETLVRVVNEDISETLPSITVPVLMLWGGKDTATPPEHAQRMKTLLPDAALQVYPEAGHYVFLDEPAACLKAVQEFLERVSDL